MSWPPGLEGGGLVFLRSERGGLFMKELREGMLASVWEALPGLPRFAGKAGLASLRCQGCCTAV
tara:strand:+ start:430 stop:621 length:192 start_codon:yes stop_codon:yes gene_type:complete